MGHEGQLTDHEKVKEKLLYAYICGLQGTLEFFHQNTIATYGIPTMDKQLTHLNSGQTIDTFEFKTFECTFSCDLS